MCFNSCNPHLSQNSSLQTLLFFIQGSSLSLTLSCSGTLPCFPRWLPIIAPIAGINYYIFNIKPDTAAYLLSLNASPCYLHRKALLKIPTRSPSRYSWHRPGEKSPVSWNWTPGFRQSTWSREQSDGAGVMEQEWWSLEQGERACAGEVSAALLLGCSSDLAG